MYKCLLLSSILFSSASKADLVDIFHRRTSSTVAVMSGMEDLSEAIEDTSEVSRDFSSTRQLIGEMKAVLSTGDELSEDSKYIVDELDSRDDFSSFLSKSASKIRRAKKLARAASLISSDPETNTSLQATETNILLARMIENEKSNKAEKSDLKLRKAKILIAEQKQKQKEIEIATNEVFQHQKKSGIVFHRFNTAKPTQNYIYSTALKEALFSEN